MKATPVWDAIGLTVASACVMAMADSMLAEETEYEVDMARKEMQWDTEKRNVALRKLKAWYLDPLEA